MEQKDKKLKNETVESKRSPVVVLRSVEEIGDGKRCKKIGIEKLLMNPIREDEDEQRKARYQF